MDANFKRNLLVSSGVSIFILIISAVASFLSIRSLLDSSWMVSHTYESINNLNYGEAELTEAQTSMRGYLITGDNHFIENISQYKEKAEYYFGQVAVLTKDNPKQQQSLKQLLPVKEQFFEYLEKRISEKKQNILVTTYNLEEGQQIMGRIRRILKQMEDEEKNLLAERTTTAEKYSYYSLILIIIGAIVAIGISIVFFIRILKDYNQRVLLVKQLEQSDKETAERIRLTSSIASQIAKGNYSVRVSDTEGDALGSMGTSLNDMAKALDNSFRALSDKEWLQTGVAELNKVMIGEKPVNELTRNVIKYLSEYTGSNAGILYLMNDDRLDFSAGYSFTPHEKVRQLELGQGITGEAAVSGTIVELKGFDKESIKINYAMGEAAPAHIIAVPLIDDRVTGVVELATVTEYTPREIEFLTTAAHNIAIAITTAKNRARVQELLEETQAQSEELLAQHSELESINAELEVQTEKLQASEEELRVQQEELQQSNEELAERSALLEEKNLEIQKKSEDLELSTRYKSEFLANMSHELRTPLNSILLLSRLLSENGEENMTQEQIEFAKVINSSGHGLLGLIDEILDLSKIEAGKMELEFQDIAMNEVTSSLKALFTEVAREKGITFKVEADNAPVVIRTDKMRLEQILKNLISNAIKFTSEGSVTLQVNTTEDNMVSFAVKDTGIGIPREKQPLIFEAFQQADGSTKRKYGGTGLGLSISRELAKLLQGDIALESTPGEGSIFTLTIPVIGSGAIHIVERPVTMPETTPAADAQATENKEPEKKYISLTIPESIEDDRDTLQDGDKTILIVEDDVNFAKSLLQFTRKRGYKGITTVRGDLALGLALKYKPVGILLDIELPVKSGWEVMEELKNDPETRHIPVHIMSSHKLKQESLLKGAVNFLDKPVAYEQIPEIFTRIEHIVNRESQKVLIFEDNPKHAKALAYFLEANDINSEIRSEVSEGIDILQKDEVHCVILDMGVPDRQAYEVLESVKKDKELENLPIIVFTGKSLSMKEELKIKKYADSIIVKTAHSYQRMLDEVSLFLHLVEEKKNGKKEELKKMNLLNNVLNGKTVLVVDDDVRNIYSLTKSLETLKMNVITAIDGKEALKSLDENPNVDVVLLDMMMPNMDGYETATRIRQNPRFKNLPVIAVTAKAMTGDREKCINAGASDYITKPVDVDQLMSLLRVWLYDKQ